jgi:hypothetical protein
MKFSKLKTMPRGKDEKAQILLKSFVEGSLRITDIPTVYFVSKVICPKLKMIGGRQSFHLSQESL